MLMCEVEQCGWIKGRERAAAGERGGGEQSLFIGDCFPKLQNCRVSAERNERFASSFLGWSFIPLAASCGKVCRSKIATTWPTRPQKHLQTALEETGAAPRNVGDRSWPVWGKLWPSSTFKDWNSRKLDVSTFGNEQNLELASGAVWSNLHYSRLRGHFSTKISPLNCSLWSLKTQFSNLSAEG